MLVPYRKLKPYFEATRMPDFCKKLKLSVKRKRFFVVRRSLRLLLHKLFSGEVGANNPFEVIADAAAGGVQQVTNAWDAAVAEGKEVGPLIALIAFTVIEVPVKRKDSGEKEEAGTGDELALWVFEGGGPKGSPALDVQRGLFSRNDDPDQIWSPKNLSNIVLHSHAYCLDSTV
jgi:hypothetical protein